LFYNRGYTNYKNHIVVLIETLKELLFYEERDGGNMITVYLAGIPAYYEGEDIEIRYGIYRNENLLERQALLKDYKKPAVVGPFALLTILKELEDYQEEDITIIVNDPALDELMEGTSTTKNAGVLKMTNMAKDQLRKFPNAITVRDISEDSKALAKWDEILKF